MSLTAYSSDSGGFVLHAYGRAIGWIEGRGIGFGGFASTGDALAAALVAHAALGRWLARERLEDMGARPDAEITVRPDESHDWLLMDGRPIGRIITPGMAPLSVEGPAFGFELFLPRGVGTVAALGVAHVIYHAVFGREKSAPMNDAPSNARRREGDDPAVSGSVT